MRTGTFFSFDQAADSGFPGLVVRLAAQARVAALAYPLLALAAFVVATGATLLNPRLLEPAELVGPLPLAPQLTPVAQDCLERANREVASVKASPELKAGVAALLAMSCLDRAYTAQAAEPPGAPIPH